MSNKIILIFLGFVIFLSPASAFSADELIVGTIERPPFMFYSGGELTGFSVELWDQIAKEIPITYRWNEYQQFSDMINDTVAGKNDLAVANISITSGRERTADFSQP
ncbi:MAG: transporter substrate-binding domain-containing protein, partial [Desulfuromusa sp.]|nr:transporter substrate-binding domain-containing protein [Desulfuromusa sp.]